MLKSVVEKLFWKYHVLEPGPFVDLEKAEEVYRGMGNVPGAQLVLKSMLSADKDRYFKATTPEQQAAIRGQYLRTLQLLRHMRFEPSVTPKGTVARKTGAPFKGPGRYATGA